MRNVPLPSFINKPHQEKGKTGKFFKKIKGKIKAVGGKIKEGTKLIGDRIKEGVANTKDVVSDIDVSGKVQEIREENQYDKELESLAGIYGETTNVPPQDVINLANWGRFTPETDTLINVNQYTTHQSHAIRQMLRNQGGGAFSGSLSMQDVGGKGSDLSNYSSGTRNLIFDKEKYLNTVKPNKRKTKK